MGGGACPRLSPLNRQNGRQDSGSEVIPTAQSTLSRGAVRIRADWLGGSLCRRRIGKVKIQTERVNALILSYKEVSWRQAHIKN